MHTVVLGTALAAALTGGALGQDGSLLLPDLPTELTSPRYFEGLYVGAGFASLSGHPNFWVGGGEIAYGGILSAGYGHYLTDNLIIGAEVSAAAGDDFAGNVRHDVLAMLHLGVLTGPYFRAYSAVGAGWFQSASAWAAGLGAEWALRDNLSFQTEFLVLGQIGPSSSGLYQSAISAYHLKAGVIWHFGDKPVEPEAVFSPAGAVTDFEGPYVSGYFGFLRNPGYNIFYNTGNGFHMSRGSFGLAAGWNFSLAPDVVAGLELQSGILFNGSGDIQNDTLLLARAGLVPIEGLFVYAEGGAGMVVDRPVYALGAGVEWAAWGNASLRGDIIGLGEIAPATPGAAGFSAFKVMAGPTWHFD